MSINLYIYYKYLNQRYKSIISNTASRWTRSSIDLGVENGQPICSHNQLKVILSFLLYWRANYNKYRIVIIIYCTICIYINYWNLYNLSIPEEIKISIHTFRNIAHENGSFLLIGAQQNTYRARNGKGTCCIISARNLKSSVLHIKYKESSTIDRVTKISWNNKHIIFCISEINVCIIYNITKRFDNGVSGKW